MSTYSQTTELKEWILHPNLIKLEMEKVLLQYINEYIVNFYSKK